MNEQLYRQSLEEACARYEGDYEGNGQILKSGNALLYLAIAAKETDDPAAIARLTEHLVSLTTGGNEPQFTAGPFWSYASVSLGIAVCRRIPALMEGLDGETCEKLDLLMKCFAIASAFVSNDCNDYITGPGLTGNHRKSWNPNHRMAMVFPIVAAAAYFSSDGGDGAAYVNRVLTEFDYDAYIKAFCEYGWSRALYCWTAEGIELADGTRSRSARELMTEGGEAHLARLDRGGISNKLQLGRPLGSGAGVRHPFFYHGMPLSDLAGIAADLYAFNYSGGKVISDTSSLERGLDENGKPLCYIADGVPSPVEGEIGMMYEFCSVDAGGIRSSASYCAHDFALVVSTLLALEVLEVYRLDLDSDLGKKIRIGNIDLIHKLTHGYRSYSIGKGYDHCAEAFPEFLFWKVAWLERCPS